MNVAAQDMTARSTTTVRREIFETKNGKRSSGTLTAKSLTQPYYGTGCANGFKRLLSLIL